MKLYNRHINSVKAFHEKNGFRVGVDLKEDDTSEVEDVERDMLNDAASAMFLAATAMQRHMGKYLHSVRIERAQIMIEELAETVEALITRDEVALLDGLADLQFVTMGTAVAYGLPLEEAHSEVCRSNLSKKKRETQGKLVDKGPDYSPPDLKRVLLESKSITVNAKRTSCTSTDGIAEDVTLTCRLEFIKSLDEWYAKIVDGGGVTGYESISAEDLQKHGGVSGKDWYACVGTPGKWDTLVVPCDEMLLLRDWVNEHLGEES